MPKAQSPVHKADVEASGKTAETADQIISSSSNLDIAEDGSSSLSESDQDEAGIKVEADETSSSDLSSSTDGDEALDENVDDLAQANYDASRLQTKPLQTSNLQSKLSAFLPQIAQANKDLTTGVAERVDDVADDAEHFIEMNLGLGVLSEKPHRKRTGEVQLYETDSSSDTMDSTEDDEHIANPPSRVMENLKGGKRQHKRRKIEVLK